MSRLPFVLGTDIIQISRLDPIRRPQHFVKLARRILRSDEINTASQGKLHKWLNVKQQAPPLSTPTDPASIKTFEVEAANAVRWLAGRWAAKEAAMKAWGAGLITWKNIKVDVDSEAPFLEGSSRPVKVECHPYTEDVLRYAKERGEDPAVGKKILRQDGRLSISHDGDYCVATVIAEPLDEELLTIFRKTTAAVKEQANEKGLLEKEHAEENSAGGSLQSSATER